LDCVQHLYKKTGWNLVDWLVGLAFEISVDK